MRFVIGGILIYQTVGGFAIKDGDRVEYVSREELDLYLSRLKTQIEFIMRDINRERV